MTREELILLVKKIYEVDGTETEIEAEKYEYVYDNCPTEKCVI